MIGSLNLPIPNLVVRNRHQRVCALWAGLGAAAGIEPGHKPTKFG
jgi:hypothetical protein